MNDRGPICLVFCQDSLLSLYIIGVGLRFPIFVWMNRPQTDDRQFNLPATIAGQLRQFYFGGNWTSVNLKDVLADVSWQQAIAKVNSFNTIAALVYHINYYVCAVQNMLLGEPLHASDKFSFDLPRIESEEDWQKLLEKTWSDADTFAGLIGQLADERLGEDFADGKYGTYYRNLTGIIEHAHYHLGQIVLIKKMIGSLENEV